MQENKAQIPFYTSPKERDPQLGKTRPKREENKVKPKSNHFIFVGHPCGPTQKVQRRPLTKDGPIQGDWRCGHNPSGPIQAQTSRATSHRLSLVSSGGDGSNINAETSVCSFHMGMGNILKNPLLPPIKGGPLLLIDNNTQEKKSTKEQEHHSMGLGPS